MALLMIGFGAALATNTVSNLRQLWQRTSRKSLFSGLLLGDAVFAGASYGLLILASADGALAAHAIVFESWPIFGMLMLYVLVPKGNDLTFASLMAIGVFIVGYVFLNFKAFEVADLFRLSTYYSLLSALLMAAAVVTMQIALREFPALKHARLFPVIIGIRGLLTGLVVWLMFLAWDDVSWAGTLDPTFLALSIGIGALVAINQITYHIGTSKSASNSVLLIALFSPVLAPLLLMLLGEAVPNTDFFVGAAFIVSGIALTHRDGGNTIQYVTLLLSILLIGATVHYSSGTADPQFFNYLNIASLFYALLQTSTFSRLWSSQLEMERQSRAVVMMLKRRHANDVREKIRDSVNFLKSYGRSNATLSELVLLTVLAGSNIVIVIFTRNNSLLGDSIAFLISVTSAFLITYCWHMQFRILRLSRHLLQLHNKRTQFAHIVGRMVNVVFLIALFVYFIAVIFAENV